MNEIGDWFFPSGDQNAWRWVPHKIAQANYYADLIPAAKRDTVIQAGGNVDVYPITLAKRFERVISFEPSPILFECLNANTNRDVLCPPDIRNRLLICNAALGSRADNVAVNYAPENCEATHIEPAHDAREAVQMIPLDRLQFRACDLLILDIEGYELPALIGATATIAQHRPVIVLEIAPEEWASRYGYTNADLFDHMDRLGYSAGTRVTLGNACDDYIFHPRERT